MAWKKSSRHKFLYVKNSQHILISLIEEWREYVDKNFVIRTAFTDLPNAFDCVPRSPLIAKLKSYGLGGKALSYIYLYLTNRNQCCHINYKKSNFVGCPSKLLNKTNPA